MGTNWNRIIVWLGALALLLYTGAGCLFDPHGTDWQPEPDAQEGVDASAIVDATVPDVEVVVDASPDAFVWDAYVPPCTGDTFECQGNGSARVCRADDWVELGPCPLGCDATAMECRVPSNVPVDDFLLGTGALTVTAAESIVTINTDTGEIIGQSGTIRGAVMGYDSVSGIWFGHRAQTGTTVELGVYSMTALNVEAGAQLNVVGQRALALLVNGVVDIHGLMVVRGRWEAPGPGGFGGGPANADALGPCPGLVGDGNLHNHGCSSGGGGGGHGGAGGAGGNASCGSYIGGAGGADTCGVPELVPLVGGSGGAGGSEYDDATATSEPGLGGGGGGGIQISSAGTVTIYVDGGINAGGGQGAGCSAAGGAGGGAGGAILLEAPTVDNQAGATLAANGGGGGGGDCT